MKAIDPSRVETYADKLQREGYFQVDVPVKIAANLRVELVRRGKKINDSTLSFEPLITLCGAAFTKDFWMESAKRALGYVELWIEEERPSICMDEMHPRMLTEEISKKLSDDSSSVEHYVVVPEKQEFKGSLEPELADWSRRNGTVYVN